MDVLHGRLHIFVTHQLLNRMNIGAGFQQMSREAVSQGMRNGCLVNACRTQSETKCSRELFFADMVSPSHTTAFVKSPLTGWEDPLPGQFPAGVRILAS